MVTTAEVGFALQLARAPTALARRLSACDSRSAAAALCNSAGVVADPGLVARTERWLERPNTYLISFFDAAYPLRLKHIPQPPLCLFCEGDVELLNAFQIAFVGSRKATQQGLITTDWLVSALARAGTAITSGLAMGIDAQAHRSAMPLSATIAVIGTGPDIAYPPRHRALQGQVASTGLLVTEFPPGWPAKRDHFPRRNRIIAGLSYGVVVVEAVSRSGSLSTAAHALAQNRELFVVPNSIWEPAAEGSNLLLQQGAKAVLNADDILQEFPQREPLFDHAPAPVLASVENNPEQDLANSRLLANVGLEATTLDSLVELTGLSAAEVSEQMVLLELLGHVASVPGGFIRMRRR